MVLDIIINSHNHLFFFFFFFQSIHFEYYIPISVGGKIEKNFFCDMYMEVLTTFQQLSYGLKVHKCRMFGDLIDGGKGSLRLIL